MKIIVRMMLFLILGIISIQSKSQNFITKKLNKGDQVPELPLGELYNYPGKEKSIGDFKGKLLILDFWATWCGPCIASFPKMEKLREKFKDQLQIFPVTADPSNTVGILFDNLKKENGSELFSVVSDKAISKLFNFKSLPHYVWIDRNGRYIGDSQADGISDRTISDALNGKLVLDQQPEMVKRYNDKMPFFDLSIPITANGEKINERVENSSILSGGILTKNINGLKGVITVNNPGRFLAVNYNLGRMFSYLFGVSLFGSVFKEFFFYPNNRTFWEVEDKSLLEYSADYLNEMYSKQISGYRQFAEDRRFCYDYRVNESKDRVKLSNLAIGDLNLKTKQLLNLTAHTEKRKMKCLILKRTSNVDKVGSKNKNYMPVVEKNKAEMFSYEITDKPYLHFISSLVGLQLQGLKTPIIDETGFELKKIIKLKLNAKMYDWKSVKEALAAYDLTFEEADRVIDVVIITDK